MKRFLALLLCFALCLSLIPAAFAGEIAVVDEPESEPEDEIALIEPEDEIALIEPEGSDDELIDLDPVDIDARSHDGEIKAISPGSGATKTSFASFSQLKSLCSKTYDSETVAYCTQESGEFVFSQDLTIPVNLTVVFGIRDKGTYNYDVLDVPVRIPGGVTVTLKGKMGAAALTVDGKMILENGAYLTGYEFEDFYMTVNGSVENYGQIQADGIIGLEFIEQKSFITSRIYIDQRCSTQDEMLNLLDYYDHTYGLNLEFRLTCSAYIDFSENVTVPSNTELTLRGGGVVRAGCRLTVRGELYVEDYSSSVTLTIAGELKNFKRVYLHKYNSYVGRLKLQQGGSYLGVGSLMLSAFGDTLDVADMLPGFDLSLFTSKINGSFTQLTLTNYEEPWEDEEISSFQELKEMVESGSSDDINKYTGPNPLVIEEDLTLNAAQDMHIYPTDIVVPEGVTFTVNGFFSCHNLTVHGTMNAYFSMTTGHSEPTEFSRENPNTVIVDGALNLYGYEYTSDYFQPATLATEYLYGDENIHLLGGDNRVYIVRTVENEDDIRDVLYEAQYDYKDWKEYCPSFYSDYTLTDDLVIPRNCSLDLYDGVLTVPEGVTLTIYGKMELYGGTVNVQGGLVNEGRIRIFERNGEQIRIRDDSCYDGDGLIYLPNNYVSSLLPGFNISNYYIYYGENGGWTILTRSKEAYDEIVAGSVKPEEIYYAAEAPITFHQTEARSMLEYVNDFRTGDEAYYDDGGGGVVSLVGQLQPLEYSYSLEEIAMQRAAEIAVQFKGDHSRPNGQPWSSLMSSDGKYSNGENIAASTAPSVYSFYMSLREDDAGYSGQGHRRNMLGNYGYMGVGYTEYCGLGFLVQEFGYNTGVGEERPAVDETVVTVIEVASGNVYSYDDVTAEPEMLEIVPGGSEDFPSVSAKLFVVADFFLNTDSPVATLTPAWTVEDSGIAEIRDGKIVAIAEGETALKATVFEQEVRVPVVVSASGVQAPRITEQPQDLSLTLGEDAVLHVTASGNALKYQWYYRVKDGADWKKLSSASSQTDTLYFKANANRNNCDYRCVVSNVAGSVTSKIVHLSVSAKLDKSTLLLPYFRTDTLKLLQADGSGAKAFWSSSDPSILTVNSDGTLKPMKFGTVTVTATAGDGRITASCKVKVVFKDVNSRSKYYFNHVYWALDNGITTGYDDCTFGVGKNCQRRELLIFLWRYAGEPTVDKDGNPYGDARRMFNDLSYGPTTATNKAIAWACTEGISKGYSDGGFHPTDPIERKDVMILLYRLAGKPSVTGTLDFSDCKSYKPGTDTYNAILWGSQNEITKGYSDGTFGPRLNCLREQIVTFLSRYDSKFGS